MKTNLELIHHIRKWDLIAFLSLSFCVGFQLYSIWSFIDPTNRTNAAGVILLLIFVVLVFLVLHFKSVQRLHELRLGIDRKLGRLSDEVMHVETIREKLKEELGNAALDNTVHGAFFYGRQRILADGGCDCTYMYADFDDREFDMALFVKRKSTPLDEVLSAVHKAGRL